MHMENLILPILFPWVFYGGSTLYLGKIDYQGVAE
jgi:hypothetical protein